VSLSSLWPRMWPVSFSHCEGRYRFQLPTGGKILFQNVSTYPSLSEFLPPLQPQTLVNFYQFVG